MADEINNNFNKQELFAKWQKLSKQDLENIKHTLTDAQELAAYNEFMANYTPETENEDPSSTMETSDIVTQDASSTDTSQPSQETDNQNPSVSGTSAGVSSADANQYTSGNNSSTTEEHNDDNVQPVTPNFNKITKNEVVDIISEIQNSSTEKQYLESIDPKITDEQIEIATSFEKASDVLEALGTTDNLLVAYDYYSKKGDKEKTALIQEAMSLSVDELITNANVNITSSNAYSWSQLIRKSNTSDKDKIEEALTLVATKLKAYDTQFFGELSDEELTSNYDKANTALSTTFKDCGYKYLEDNFVFTDEKGRVLKDKSLIGKGISRFLDNGDGNDLSNCQKSIVEMARELVAQDLAKNGLKIKGEDGTERDLGQNDYERLVREKINLMLDVNPSQEGGKTPIKQSDVIGKLGSFMVGAEEFKHRASQKGYKGLYEKSTTWLKRLDDKFVERYGNKYIKAKQYAKTLGKVVKGSAIGAAKFALVSFAAGPAGVAAYIGYNTYKQWKNLSQNWDKMDNTERTCSVIANSVSSAISISMAAVGLDGLAQHLQGPIGTFASTIAENVGIWGRTAITTIANSASKILKDIELKRKRNKIASELKDCKDPKRIQELLSENKKNIIDTRQNREALAISVVSSGVGTFAGQEFNQAIAQAGGIGGIIEELGDKITDRFSEQPTDVNGAKPEGIGTESADTAKTVDTTKAVENILNMSQLADAELSLPVDHQALAQALEVTYGTKAPEILTDISKNPSEFLNNFTPEQLSNMGLSETSTPLEIANALVDPDNAATLSTVHELNAAMSTSAAEHGTTVGATSAEQAAQNIEEANATRVHSSGRSVAEMLNDKLADESDHLGRLTVAEQQELSTKLQEIYGDKAYMAGTSAMAEPYTIVSELRNSMSAEDFAKLGFDNSITSIDVLKVLVDNPQLANNAGLNHFMDTHFDAQQHFSFSEGVTPRVEHTTPESTQSEQDQGGGRRQDLSIDKVTTTITGKTELLADDKGLAIPEELTPTTTIYSEDGTILEQISDTQEQDSQNTKGVSQTPEAVLQEFEKNSEEAQQKFEKGAADFQVQQQQYTEDGYTQIEDGIYKGVYKINTDGSAECRFNSYPNAALEMLPDDIKNGLSASLVAAKLYAETQVYRDLMTQDTLSPEETIFVENYKEMIKDYGLAFDDNGKLGRAYHDTDVHRNDGVKYQCTTEGLTILSDKGLPEVEARNKVYIDLVDRGENETFGVAEKDFMKRFEKEMESQNLYHDTKGNLVEVPEGVTVSSGGMGYSITPDGVKEEGLYGYNHTVQDYMSEAKSILGGDTKAEDLIKMKNLLMRADIMEDIRSREASGEAFTPEQKASIDKFKTDYKNSFDALRENHFFGESLLGRPTTPSDADILNAQNKELMTALGLDPTSIPEGQTPQETSKMLADKAKEYNDSVNAQVNKVLGKSSSSTKAIPTVSPMQTGGKGM